MIHPKYARPGYKHRMRKLAINSVFFKDFKILEKKSWNFFAASQRKILKNDWKTNWDLKNFAFFEEKMQISIKESIKNAWKLQKSWNLSRWKCLKKNLEFFRRFAAKFLKKILIFFAASRRKFLIFFQPPLRGGWKIVVEKIP